MTGLQLNVGLFSGINYVDLVNQLIQLESGPMNRLAKRTEVLAMERDALTNTMARFLTTAYPIRRLNALQPYLRTDVTSSNPALLTAARVGSGTAVPGSYTFTPLQMASAQQTVARGVASDTTALGRTGTITLGRAWSVENDIALSDINGGDGFTRGLIRLTDGNGQRATIDLRQAFTVRDVINTINDNYDVDVIAELDGDRIVLRDVSGGDSSRMMVQEVSGGSTAASLGLMGRTVDTNGVLTGSAIWRLGENLNLSLLNDGNGLIFENLMPDLHIRTRDGSQIRVDFSKHATDAEVEAGAPRNATELTVGDLLRTINNSRCDDNQPNKIHARISDCGKRIVIDDLTVGNRLTTISPTGTNPVLRYLGLSNDASSIADMFSGITDNGNTAKMSFTDKAGKNAIIEFDNDDITFLRGVGNAAQGGANAVYNEIAHILTARLKAAGVELEVHRNAAQNGLYIIDTSGGTGTMSVQDIGTDFLARVGLGNSQETEGVALLTGATPGTIRFTDQTGKSVDVGITRGELDAVKSADDLLALFEKKLEGQSIGIEVALNDAGTNVVFKDTTGGTASRMMITDGGGSNIAFRLGLTSTKSTGDISSTIEAITAGKISVTDQHGKTAVIDIDPAHFDGVTQISGLAAKFNELFTSAGVNVELVAVTNFANNDPLSTALVIQAKDNTGIATLINIENVAGEESNIISLLGLESKQRTTTTFLAGVTPGTVTFRDQTGKSANIEITRAQLNEITSLEDLVDFFNEQLDDAGIGITAALNAGETGLVFSDTSGGISHTLLITDTSGNLTERLGLTGSTTGISDFLADVTPGKVRLTDQRGVSTEIELTQSDLDAVTSLQGLATLFNNKINASGFNSARIEVHVNSAGNGLVFFDHFYSMDPLDVEDFDGGDIITRLGLTKTQTVDALPGILEKVNPGNIRFTDQDGKSADITITETELEGITSMDDLVALFNDKLSSEGIGIEVGFNVTGNRLFFKDTTNGTESTMKIADVTGNLVALLQIDTDLETRSAPIAALMTPGTIRITDKEGNSAEITITQDDLDDWSQSEFTAGYIPYLFREKLEGTGVKIDTYVGFLGADAGYGIVIEDKSGGTGSLTIEAVDMGDGLGLTNIADLLGIAGEFDEESITGVNIVYSNRMSAPLEEYVFASVGIANRVLESNAIETQTYESKALVNHMAESHAIASQSTIRGTAIVQGTIYTRDLIGGLDTVLMSTLNGGFGIPQAKAGGAIEVQDRAGNKANLTFSQADLNSMQTLSDSVKVINKKLSDAGVKMTVRINDQKTGLQVVDNSGSSSHNLIFRDLVTNTTIPGTPAVPGVPAVNAVSGGTGGIDAVSAPVRGTGNGLMGGLTTLNFENTHLLNGFTFAFTTNSADAGYDEDDKKFTFYLDAAILSESDLRTRNQMVKQAIDDTIAAEWETIYPPAIYGEIPPPTLHEGQLEGGLANTAFNDAVSGGEIAIKAMDHGGTLGRPDGTAVLTFEGTHWMNNFTFGFTTDTSEAGYDTTAQKFTFFLDQDALAALGTDAERDAMVRTAVNAQIASVWTSIFSPSLFGEVAPPTVQASSGLASRALDDAASGAETAIKANVDGAVMGVTHVPEVPAGPDTVASANPNIASSFGLNVNTASAQAGGNILNRQFISYNTPLSELNGGAGVNMLGARIVISDSSDAFSAANPANNTPARHLGTATISIDSNLRTVGELIEFINIRIGSVKVLAKINDTGDGIVFEEFAGGSRSFVIADADSTSRFASSLGIAGMVSPAQRDPDNRGRLGVSETHHIEVEATDSLDSIRKKINDLNVGYAASILVDGSTAPYRLSVSGKQTGAAGAFNLDMSAIGLSTETMSKAKDAMLVYGDSNQSTGLILRSATNTFNGVINGINLTITGTSNTPVTVTNSRSNLDVKTALKTFVDNYNAFREKLTEDMLFQVTAQGVESHILWNSTVARAYDREVTQMLQQTINGIPGVRSLADLGITMRMNYYDTGVNSQTNTLHFDEDKFEDAWSRDPDAVQKFFFDEREYVNADGTTRKETIGWAQKFVTMADNLVGDVKILGKTQARLDILSTQIDRNTERISFLEERLKFKEQMYLTQFYAMEQAMARMSTDMASISNVMSAWQSNMGG